MQAAAVPTVEVQKKSVSGLFVTQFSNSLNYSVKLLNTFVDVVIIVVFITKLLNQKNVFFFVFLEKNCITGAK